MAQYLVRLRRDVRQGAVASVERNEWVELIQEIDSFISKLPAA